MAMSFDEAVTSVTGPGGPLEIVETTVEGRTQKVFAATPPSLRALWDTLRARGDETFLVFEDEQWSFRRVMSSVDELGAALVQRYGVARGDHVAIAMRNYPEWVIAYAAITSVGAVVVSLNAWWTGPELEYGLSDSGAKVMVTDDARLDRIADRLDALGVAAIVVRSSATLPPGAAHLADVVTEGAPLPEVAITPDDDATILYTSGTTGHPKGAVSTHRAVLTGADGLRLPGDRRVPAPGAQGTPSVSDRLHPRRTALPRDGLHPGHVGRCPHRIEAGDDAQVGPGACAGVDRA